MSEFMETLGRVLLYTLIGFGVFLLLFPALAPLIEKHWVFPYRKRDEKRDE